MTGDDRRATCGARQALRGDTGLLSQRQYRPLPLNTEGAMNKFLRYMLISMTRVSILKRDWPIYAGC